MAIGNYDELNSLQIDALREVGSIGSGNAATSLSSVINKRIELCVPEVRILENNAMIKKLGGAEKIIAGILVKVSGEIDGMILYMQSIDFINVVLESVLSRTIQNYDELTEMETSALIEIGNIMISSYINAIADMAGLQIKLSPPAISINMLGAVLSVPMVEYGHETDKTMLIDGNIICDCKVINGNLIMFPSVKSLDKILRKLGVSCG